jgi:hypothetical protein
MVWFELWAKKDIAKYYCIGNLRGFPLTHRALSSPKTSWALVFYLTHISITWKIPPGSYHLETVVNAYRFLSIFNHHVIAKPLLSPISDG